MSDISKISISILYGYMNDFSNEKSNFSSVSRATYNSSYINNSSDDIVLKMKSSLDKYYGRLDNGYSKINEWFSDYVNSAIALGNYIAGSGSYGSITEDRLRNYASYNLKELPHYKAEFRNFQLKGSTSMFNKVLAKGTGAVNDTISYLGLEDEVNFVYDVANAAYDNIVVPYIKPAVSAVIDFYERTYATVSTGVLSVAEGVLEFGEDIVDLGYILCTAVSSIATGVADGVQAISSLITGNEWESMTKKMWNETLDFTSEEHVKNCFNEFYESNVVGQYLKEKSFGFDTVRSVGSGVGYTAGIIVTSAATGGSTVLIAGAAGTSRGINDARRDGATISESLLYGAASGAWESFQWYLGSEIISKLKIGLPKDGLATIGKKALNSLVKVMADSADSAVEGFVQPALKSIYKDSVVDANGNTISLENKSILEKYKELFNENGGWQTVLTQAAIGGLMSGGSEIIDIGKYNRQLKETGANITEPKLKNNDVDAINNVTKNLDNQMAQSNNYTSIQKQPLLTQFKKSTDSLAGSQSSCLKKLKKIIKTSADKAELANLEATVRKYYPDMSKQEMEAFFSRLNKHGCTYVAASSSIFEQLNYDANLFREKFGFEMYLPDGSLNHDQLILDIFSSMSTMVEVDYRFKKTSTYKTWSEALESIFGINPNTIDNPYNFAIDSLSRVKFSELVKEQKLNISTLEDDFGNINISQFLESSINSNKIIGTPNDIAKNLLGLDLNIKTEKELIDILNKNDITASIITGLDESKDGTKIFNTSNPSKWINAYFQKNNVDMKFDISELSDRSFSTEDILNKLTKKYNDGYSIEVSAINGKTTRMTNGSKLGWVAIGEEGTGHAMIFKGITENNDIIVSSWGEYFMIPSDYLNNLEFNFIKSVPIAKQDLTNSIESAVENKIFNASSGRKISFTEQIKNMFMTSSDNSKSATISSPPNYVNNVDSLGVKKRQEWLKLWSNKLNTSEDVIKSTFNQKLNQIVTDSDFGIRVKDDTLYTILKDGSFKNQFETGTSTGVLDISSRMEAENNLFNVPNIVESSDRPVYGMLFPKLENDKSVINYYLNPYNGRSYGDTVVILKKDNVINNTTLTLGDSLAFKDKLSATLASNPKFSGNSGWLYKNINSLEELQNANLSTFADGINSYPEIQLHGSSTHSIDNIERIVFIKEPDKKLLKLLKKKGIDWEIVPR